MSSNNLQSDPIVIITIDGPAGAGKSTVAKRLAAILEFSYIDTGAMYRALTLKAMNQHIDLEDENALFHLAKQTDIDLEFTPDGVKVLLDNKDVSAQIRAIEVTNNTFYIARAPKVREVMVQWQREIGSRKNIVIEGRDVGTVVFPHATHKIYLDANLEERSSRRVKELRERGKDVDDQQLTREIKERDFKDIHRKAGPLKQADDAILIDTTHLSIEESVTAILGIIKTK